MNNYQVLHKLWAMSAHSLHSLEHINLSVLDDLLYAGICSAVHSAPGKRYLLIGFFNFDIDIDCDDYTMNILRWHQISVRILAEKPQRLTSQCRPG